MTDANSGQGAWIRRYHPGSAPARLVCFPHAGGSASYFHSVSQRLSPSLDVLAVQYPGRQDRYAEPCVSDLSELADLVAKELRPWTDRPLALFGHSMGALVAYEVARRLEADGIQPSALFASGRRAPSCRRDESVHRLSDEDLVLELKSLQGTQARLFDEPDAVRLLLPAVRNDYRAVETYRHPPGPPLSCPVLVLVGGEDPLVTREEAAAWRAHTTGAFALRTYPGGHFYLSDQSFGVLAAINSFLGEHASLPRGGR